MFDASVESGRLHRVSRLMALAIKCQGLIRSGVLQDYSDLAWLGRISKPRATQIMNLLNLAPDIQECLLFLPPTALPRDLLTERHLRPVAKLVDWDEQRKLFSALCSAYGEVPVDLACNRSHSEGSIDPTNHNETI